MASDLTVQTIRGPGSGANANQILIPSGHKVVAPAGGLVAPGQVIQTIHSSLTSSYSTSSDSWTNFTSLNITPKSTSNKILVLASFMGRIGSSNGYGFINFRGTRNGSIIFTGYPVFGSTNGAYDMRSVISFNYLDSPNSTSAVTYSFDFAADYTDGTVYINSTTNPSGITLMEIAQ